MCSVYTVVNKQADWRTFLLVMATASGRGGAGLDGFNCTAADVSTAAEVIAGLNASFSNVNFTPGVIFLRTGWTESTGRFCSYFTTGDFSAPLLVTCDDDAALAGEAGRCGGSGF